MTFTARIKAFLAREDGAMTTDFVVLTGGILLFGMVLVGTIVPQIVDFSDRTTTVAPDNGFIAQFGTPMVYTD